MSIKSYVTAETLKQEIDSGKYTTEQRNYLVRMSARLEQIGEKIGTRVTTSHVCAGGYALPVTFKVPVFGISRQKFACMLRHMTKLPAPVPAYRKPS